MSPVLPLLITVKIRPRRETLDCDSTVPEVDVFHMYEEGDTAPNMVGLTPHNNDGKVQN